MMFPIFLAAAVLRFTALDAVGADIGRRERQLRACDDLERFPDRVSCRRQARGARPWRRRPGARPRRELRR